MSDREAQLEPLYSRITRRLIPLLLLGYIAAYLDRVNVGFAKLRMLDDLGFSETVYGLGAGIFFLGYFLFEVPSNILLHRFGARRWIARIMISWGIISAAMMFVTTPAAFYTLRFLLGVAEAGFFPGVIFYLTQWYPSQRRGRITALFMTGVAISSATGSLLSGWILEAFDGVNGWAGWQWLFLLEALPAIVIGLAVLFYLTDGIESATWLSAQDKRLLSGELEREERGKASGTYLDAFRSGRVWFACSIYFCLVTGLYGIGFWLPTIVTDLGIERPVTVGMLTAIPYALAAVTMVLAGRSADRHDERRWHVAIPAALGAIALLSSVVLAGSTPLALMALTLATIGVLTAIPLFWSIPTSYLSGATAAAGIAIINSFGNLAGFVSPYVVGWIKDLTGATAAGMCYVALFLALGAVLIIAAVPSRAVTSRSYRPGPPRAPPPSHS